MQRVAEPQPVLGVQSNGEGATPSSSRPLKRPWVATLVSLVIVLGTTAFVIAQLDPRLLFGPNMDVGGDNAGHVVAVSYFVHQLLPNGELAGWDPQWFGGFPLYVFYFPLPAILVALIDPIFHFAVSFKLVTVLGTAAMPVAGYLFGRLAQLRRPIPELFCLAMVPFLFNTSYTIDGGNLASTLAGEFSFTLAMAFGLVFLGAVVRALRTGRLRWLAALLYALMALCHVVPALYFAGAAVVLTLLLAPNWRSVLRVLVPIGAVGTLLAGFFLVPFAADLRYSSSMGYSRVGDPLHQLFPMSAELAVQALAGIGLLFGLARKDRIAIALVIFSLGAAAAFMVLPSGLVYNGRWLPFWFASTALLAAMGVAFLGEAVLQTASQYRLNEVITPIFAAVVTIGIAGYYLGSLPFYSTPSANESFVPYWVSWNYSGYQAKPGWGEFVGIIKMLDRAAQRYGCGRLDYEYSPNWTDTFGSSLVPMSFPMWTNGCIDSAEGLYYESSTSTDFHFLDQSELSVDSSDPVVGIPYQPLNVADGIRHLALSGVRYFLANSTTVEVEANADPQLVRIGSLAESSGITDGSISSSSTTTTKALTPKWVLYRIKNAPLVEALHYDPVVEAGISSATWHNTAISWYQDEAAWNVPITTTGPSSWPREPVGELVTTGGRPLPSDTVNGVRYTNNTIKFSVSRPGVPVYVKVPYFPNWQASGAKGPFLSTPNLMVVVPTRHHVSLHYGSTSADWLGRVASLVGLAGLVAYKRPLGPTSTPSMPGSDGSPATDEEAPTDELVSTGDEQRDGGEADGVSTGSESD